MARDDFVQSLDASVEAALEWLYSNGTWFFDAVDSGLDEVFEVVEWLFRMPPFWMMIALVCAIGWRVLGRNFAVFVGFGLLGCAAMGLWDETMSTLALVVSSVFIALIFAIPIGVFAGLHAGVNRYVQVAVDVIQTIPPYVYLLPGVALIGYGPATAMTATIIVAIPPALRLTALGVQLTPAELVELGLASGSSPMQTLFKIRLPVALPSIMAGINQSLMVSVGMVVIAGIVGAQGLGFVIYEAIRTLDIGKAIDGGIAIVVLTIVIDRISQGLGAKEAKAA